MESEKFKLRVAKSRVMVTQGVEVEVGNREMLVKGCKFLVIRLTNSQYVIHSIVIITSNTARLYFKCFHHTNTKEIVTM